MRRMMRRVTAGTVNMVTANHAAPLAIGCHAVEHLRRRIQRLLLFVEQVKCGEAPNASSFARELRSRQGLDEAFGNISDRTIKRDIAYLVQTLGCPLDYDPRLSGYTLADPTWTFPLQALTGAAVFPNIQLAGTPAPPVNAALREAMYAPVTLTDPAGANVQALLPLVVAAHGTPDLQPALVETILYAWQQRRLLRLSYHSPRRSGPAQRHFEPHLLFAQEGIWYLRGWCLVRQAPRTLAIHRISAARALAETFAPRPELAHAHGNALGFDTVQHVIVHACPAAAAYFAEREWFVGQCDRHLPDGTLEMTFPAVPRPVLLGWLLYNAPELTLIHPPELVAELRRRATLLSDVHSNASSNCK
jgi:predicted DNA-binding transcriptional regulator YafY